MSDFTDHAIDGPDLNLRRRKGPAQTPKKNANPPPAGPQPDVEKVVERIAYIGTDVKGIRTVEWIAEFSAAITPILTDFARSVRDKANTDYTSRVTWPPHALRALDQADEKIADLEAKLQPSPCGREMHRICDCIKEEYDYGSETHLKETCNVWKCLRCQEVQAAYERIVGIAQAHMLGGDFARFMRDVERRKGGTMRRLLFPILLLGALNMSAQNNVTTGASVAITAYKSWSFQFITSGRFPVLLSIVNPNGVEVFIVNRDGTSTHTSDFNPDIAATEFWKAFANAYPQICKERP